MYKIKDIKAHLFNSLEKEYPDTEIQGFYRLILEEIFNFNRSNAIIYGENTISELQKLKIQDVITKLSKGNPIQYVLGYSWFYENKFLVNNDVLIPRPETEELVHWVLQHDLSEKKLLDIGTGSSCISSSIALNSKAVVHALDVSKNALGIAQMNAENLKAEVKFFCADILSDKIQDELENYDIIVSNPPYVLESDKSTMRSNVLGYEPHLALFVPDDNSLLFYERIVKIAVNKLNKGGLIFFEIHEQKGKDIITLLKDHKFNSIELKKDFQNKNRMVKAVWKL